MNRIALIAIRFALPLFIPISPGVACQDECNKDESECTGGCDGEECKKLCASDWNDCTMMCKGGDGGVALQPEGEQPDSSAKEEK